MENQSKEKIRQNRRKLVKLVLIVFFAWLITLIYYLYVLVNFGSIDNFVWGTYGEENSSIFYLIFAFIVGYVWVLGSFLILVIGVTNLFLIKRNKIKYKMVDFLIVLFPIALYGIRLIAKFPIIEKGMNLPVY